VQLFAVGSCFVYQQQNDVHKSSSLEVYYQCSVEETHNNVVLELFCQIISEPCFDILRTQEQLGTESSHRPVTVVDPSFCRTYLWPYFPALGDVVIPITHRISLHFRSTLCSFLNFLLKAELIPTFSALCNQNCRHR